MKEETPIKMLKKDHEKVKELFSQFYASDEDEKLDIVKKIASELEVHMGVEEELFYPEVMKISEAGKKLTQHAKAEHQKAKEIIGAIKYRSEIGKEEEDRIRDLESIIDDHVEEEETEMFPLAEDNLQDKLGLVLSAKMLALKQKLKME